MTFMLAYWLTVGLLGFAIMAGGFFILDNDMESTDGYGAALFLYWWRRALIVLAVLVLGGIWVPVFIPGLY